MQIKDMDEIIEALTVSIVRQETEENFFRRSAEKTGAGEVRALFLNIADDLRNYRKRLEEKKAKYVAYKACPAERKQKVREQNSRKEGE